MRTIKLCETRVQRPTTLLEAIRRSAVELERTGKLERVSSLARPNPAPNAKTALA